MSQRHPGLPLARCGAFRRGSSALHKHARAAELGAATRLANRAPGAAEPMTPSRKRCVPRRPEPCEARRGHPARLTLPWSPWRYLCHCSPPTALGQLRGGGSGACTRRTDQPASSAEATSSSPTQDDHRIEPSDRKKRSEMIPVASQFQGSASLDCPPCPAGYVQLVLFFLMEVASFDDSGV